MGQNLLYLSADHYLFIDNVFQNGTVEFWVLNPKPADPRFESELHRHFAMEQMAPVFNRRISDLFRAGRPIIRPVPSMRLTTTPDAAQQAEIAFDASFITQFELPYGTWYFHCVRDLR